jgi:hypothetical protein
MSYHKIIFAYYYPGSNKRYKRKSTGMEQRRGINIQQGTRSILKAPMKLVFGKLKYNTA